VVLTGARALRSAGLGPSGGARSAPAENARSRGSSQMAPRSRTAT